MAFGSFPQHVCEQCLHDVNDQNRIVLPFVENEVEFSGRFEEAITAEFTPCPVKDSERLGDFVQCIPISQGILDSAQ